MTMPLDVKAIICAENDQPDLPWGEQTLLSICGGRWRRLQSWAKAEPRKFVVGILRSFSLECVRQI
jgi:hypothetical protein